MGRFAENSDDERLPEHVRRCGYDADTQVYTFEDTTTGRTWESAPGNRYGVLHPTGQPREPAEIEAQNADVKTGNRESLRIMLPFALLVLVFLLLVFKFIDGGPAADGPQVECDQGHKAIQVQEGETCWGIGKARGLSVAELLRLQGNGGVECGKLRVGQGLCVPV